jgi:hypothetical protein
MTTKRHFIAGFMLALTAFLPAASYAQQVKPAHPVLERLIAEYKGQRRVLGGLVAHRGIFHPSYLWSEKSLPGIPENSIASIDRTRALGVTMAEIDVRLTKDGVAYVTHDRVLNRSTTIDVGPGHFNILRAAAAGQPMQNAIPIARSLSSELNTAQLKGYGLNNAMSVGGKLLTLKSFLATVDKNPKNPLLILDLQDPQTTKAAAAVVKELGLQKRVVLKFFANSAVVNNGSSGQDGVNKTIASWGNGLFYIIQFNNGQLSYDENDARPVGITKFGKRWTIREYAEAFMKTGRVIGVSMSIPTAGTSVWAVAPTKEAAAYFNRRSVPVFGVLVNPDASIRFPSGACKMISFQANPDVKNRVAWAEFRIALHKDRRAFADNQLYKIADVMPNQINGIWQMRDSYDDFQRTWCN